MADCWFVSDIHIDSMNDPKARDFLAFLNSLKKERSATHLFLVGDIFDLWVADHDYFTKRFQPIVDRLKDLKQEGLEIHYFEGNHDLHLSKFWQYEMGITVHRDAQYFDLNEKVVRVEHGDQTDPEDSGYLFLRWFLRTWLMTWLSYHLPEKAVSWIGKKASHASRDYTSNTKRIDESSARAKLHCHSERANIEKHFDLLVYGHVHIVDDFENEKFRSINLGTWLEKPRALHFSATNLTLIDL